MSLIDAINQLHKELKDNGIELRKIIIKGNLEKCISGENYLKYINNDLLYRGYKDKDWDDKENVTFRIHEDKWILNYRQPDDMSEDYFLTWRPSFREIKRLGNNLKGTEIGIFEGFLTDQVLKYINPSLYYLIDPYIPYTDVVGGALSQIDQNTWDEIYKETSSKYKDRENVRIIRKTSQEALSDVENNSLDFAYIDGNHTEDAVYNDIVGWFTKVRAGGIIAGHDFVSPSVRKGVLRFLAEQCLDEQNKLKTFFPFIHYKDEDWWFVKE